jgi:hypothetical protein
MARNLIMLDGLSRSEKAGIEGRHSLLHNLGAFFRKALYRGASLPVSVKPFHLSSDLPSCRSSAARFWRTWINLFRALVFGEVHIVQRFMKQVLRLMGLSALDAPPVKETRQRKWFRDRRKIGSVHIAGCSRRQQSGNNPAPSILFSDKWLRRRSDARANADLGPGRGHRMHSVGPLHRKCADYRDLQNSLKSILGF